LRNSEVTDLFEPDEDEELLSLDLDRFSVEGVSNPATDVGDTSFGFFAVTPEDRFFFERMVGEALTRFTPPTLSGVLLPALFDLGERFLPFEVASMVGSLDRFFFDTFSVRSFFDGLSMDRPLRCRIFPPRPGDAAALAEEQDFRCFFLSFPPTILKNMYCTLSMPNRAMEESKLPNHAPRHALAKHGQKAMHQYSATTTRFQKIALP